MSAGGKAASGSRECRYRYHGPPIGVRVSRLGPQLKENTASPATSEQRRATRTPAAILTRVDTHATRSLSRVALAAVPATLVAQQSGYPITVVPTGKGPFTFPAGYQIPWERIEIMVTEKMSPNLFVLHGSQGLDTTHPDASGGRAMALFGPEGVLLVDSQNRQVGDKTLKAVRSFTDGTIRIVVNTQIPSDHT